MNPTPDLIALAKQHTEWQVDHIRQLEEQVEELSRDLAQAEILIEALKGCKPLRPGEGI